MPNVAFRMLTPMDRSERNCCRVAASTKAMRVTCWLPPWVPLALDCQTSLFLIAASRISL